MATATRTRKPAAKKSTAKKVSDKPKFDPYAEITNKIIELLEQGTVAWHKPWKNVGGLPVSMSTKKVYRGINILLLQMAADANGYSSPWWGTYDQITARGGQVRKGEKSTMIVFWKWLKLADKDTNEVKTIPMLRTFRVFNAEQADGEMGLPKPEVLADHDPIAECEAAIAGYLGEGGPGYVESGDRACYSPAMDEVRMPKINQFDSPEEYYGAKFHELIHSTGHASRLNRPDLLNFHHFGDESYSKEELVAEMGSAFLAGHTGIAARTLNNSAAYLASWIDVLKGDPKMIVKAAAQAQKAADLVLGKPAFVATEDDEAVPAKAA